MGKKALALKGLVAQDQDCMTVYPTSDMQNWLVPAAGAHAVIGKALTNEKKFSDSTNGEPEELKLKQKQL